jgi:hypothetical protein
VRDWFATRAVRLGKDYQRGWYVQLIAESWQYGGFLPNDPELLWQLAGASSKKAFERNGGDLLVLGEFDPVQLDDGAVVLRHRSLFASPIKLGRQPWSYDQVLRSFHHVGKDAGIGWLGTHSMRHSYRSWLDAVGTGIAVQQKLMRHSDIRTTMNVYGTVVTDEMSTAASKVAGLALNGLRTDCDSH